MVTKETSIPCAGRIEVLEEQSGFVRRDCDCDQSTRIDLVKLPHLAESRVQ